MKTGYWITLSVIFLGILVLFRVQHKLSLQKPESSRVASVSVGEIKEQNSLVLPSIIKEAGKKSPPLITAKNFAKPPAGFDARKVDPEFQKKKLQEYGLVIKTVTGDQQYHSLESDHRQPIVLFSKLKSECPDAANLTGQAVIKVSRDGKVVSGVYTRTGENLPVNFTNCQFTVPRGLAGFAAVNVMYNP